MGAILFLHFYNIFEFYFYYINDDDDDYHIDVYWYRWSEFEHNASVMSMMMKVHYRLLKDTHSMNYQYKNVLMYINLLIWMTIIPLIISIGIW